MRLFDENVGMTVDRKNLARRYVVGFAFNRDKSHVLLIRKERPEWQKGLLNGLGGHIEDGETPMQAMIREMQEESALEIIDWNLRTSFHGPSYELFVYSAVHRIQDAIQMTDEALIHVEVNSIWNAPVIPNLRWLIPLCLDPAVLDSKVLHDISTHG
jgi:8-oxo-dGTP diphosphatase